MDVISWRDLLGAENGESREKQRDGNGKQAGGDGEKGYHVIGQRPVAAESAK